MVVYLGKDETGLTYSHTHVVVSKLESTFNSIFSRVTRFSDIGIVGGFTA